MARHTRRSPHRDISALPAVAGAALVTGGAALGWPSTPVLVTSAALIAAVGLLAIWRGWDTPRLRQRYRHGYRD